MIFLVVIIECFSLSTDLLSLTMGLIGQQGIQIFDLQFESNISISCVFIFNACNY